MSVNRILYASGAGAILYDPILMKVLGGSVECCRPSDAPKSAIVSVSGSGTIPGSIPITGCGFGHTLDFTWPGETATVDLSGCAAGQCRSAWSGECEISGGFPCVDDDDYEWPATSNLPDFCPSVAIKFVWGFTLYHNVPCQPSGWSYIVSVAIGVVTGSCTSCGNQFFGDPQVQTGDTAPPSCSAIPFVGPTGIVSGTATAADYPLASFPYTIEFSSDPSDCTCFS